MVHKTAFSRKTVCQDKHFSSKASAPYAHRFFLLNMRKNALPKGVATGKNRTFARPVGRWKTAGARRYMHRHFVI
jgi:hypothetical protein